MPLLDVCVGEELRQRRSKARTRRLRATQQKPREDVPIKVLLHTFRIVILQCQRFIRHVHVRQWRGERCNVAGLAIFFRAPGFSIAVLRRSRISLTSAQPCCERDKHISPNKGSRTSRRSFSAPTLYVRALTAIHSDACHVRLVGYTLKWLTRNLVHEHAWCMEW